MKTLLGLFAVCIPLLFFGQSIQIHSIKAIRQPSGDNGYSLDGAWMTGARAKLLNPSNFGPSGTYTKTVLISDTFDLSGSLTDVASLPVNDIFFFGNFDIMNVSETFTPDEVNALYDWSARGGKMIICAGQTDGNMTFDSRILNQQWGFSFFESNALVYPTALGNSSGPFYGPFAHGLPSVSEGGPVQGYFDSVPQNIQVYATSPSKTTVFMDCNTLDLIVADVDMFTAWGGITAGGNIQNNQDKFWANTIAFMDQLQPLPVLANTGDTLAVSNDYLQYQWYKDDKPIHAANSNTFTVDSFGTYHVETMVNGGCLVRSNDFIKPDTTLILDNECDLFVPTAFSPDGNGVNERLCMYGRCFENIEFKIFDRWGEMVFESKERWSCWDGTYKGNKANTGTYVWSVRATRPSGTTINRKGNTTLIR